MLGLPMLCVASASRRKARLLDLATLPQCSVPPFQHPHEQQQEEFETMHATLCA